MNFRLHYIGNIVIRKHIYISPLQRGVLYLLILLYLYKYSSLSVYMLQTDLQCCKPFHLC